jgi:DNA-binding transcriptional LysR family regulator
MPEAAAESQESIRQMNLSRVDLNLFVVFEAIFTTGGITAAASRLNLSQSAVSHALARLRLLFDDPLFERSTRGMAPTARARALAADVRLALSCMEGTLRRSGEFDPASAQRGFALALGDPIDSLLLPALMEGMERAAPRIEVATGYSNRRRIEVALRDGSLDAAVDILMPMPSDIVHEPVFSDPMVVLARRGHPLLRGAVDLDAYLGIEHIQVSSRRLGTGIADMALRRLGLRRRVRVRCQHYAAACRIVSRTDLLATMPRHFALTFNRELGNQLLAPPFPVPPCEWMLYMDEKAGGDPARQWFRSQLIEAVAQLAAGGGV